jgi:hypothetical protein
VYRQTALHLMLMSEYSASPTNECGTLRNGNGHFSDSRRTGRRMVGSNNKEHILGVDTQTNQRFEEKRCRR